jgi:hypothetical protein
LSNVGLGRDLVGDAYVHVPRSKVGAVTRRYPKLPLERVTHAPGADAVPSRSGKPELHALFDQASTLAVHFAP